MIIRASISLSVFYTLSVEYNRIGLPSRVQYAAAGAVEQNYHYYPDEGLGAYDFGARHFAPAGSRRTTPDPLAEKYYHISPYAYCAGDPVNRIDPDGCADYFNPNGVWLYNDGRDDGQVRIICDEAIQNAKEMNNGVDSGEVFFSLLESFSMSFSGAVRSGVIINDNAVKVYDYYNQTGLPIEDSESTKGAGFNYEDPNNV